MSEDNKPNEVEKTEERATGEMTAVAKPSEADAPPMPEAKASPAPEAKASPEAKVEAKVEAKPDPAPAAKSEPAPAAKPEPKAEKKKEAKDEPTRHARETMAMPVAVVVGAPPEVPGDVETPTLMPGPTDVPSGAPTDAARAPGHVPAGDSRSLRRGAEFALIYRQGSAVISRFGAVGTRGQWRVVEYPTQSSASNAYAKECSRFVGEGFSDYRD